MSTATQRRAARSAYTRQDVEIEMKVFGFELKALAMDESGAAPSFSGTGAAFFNVDSAGDVIAPGAFAEDLDDFIRNGFIGGLNHNWDDPIARPVVAYEDGKGLYLESGDIVDTAHGSDVAKLLRTGIIRKLSIGFKVLREQRITSLEAIKEFWKSHDYTPTEEDLDRAAEAIKVGHKEWDKDGELRTVKGVRMLRRIKLYEVSPVTVPANMLADVTGVKSALRGPSESKGSWRDYSREVATAVGEFTGRAVRRVHNRVDRKVGRVLSQANYDSIASVADAMESNAAQLRDVLAAAQVKRNEPASADDENPAKSAEQLAQTTAGGAPAAPTANPANPHVTGSTLGPDPAASPAAPEPDESDILAQYARTRHAVTMALVGRLIPHA
jgi:HK97 family phage prohead protease